MASGVEHIIHEQRPAPECAGYPYRCGTRDDVRFDWLTGRMLCRDCWAKVDPRAFGPRDRTS